MNITDAIWQRMQTQADSPALFYAGKEISYGDLHRIVGKLMHKLGKMGVKPGDCVAVSCIEPALYLALALAIARHGAIFSSINAFWPSTQKEQLMRRHKARWIIQDDDDSWTFSTSSDVGRTNIGDMLAALREPLPQPEPPSLGGGTEVWRISHSSGTTGSVKSVPWTHEADARLQDLQLDVFPGGPGSRLLVFSDIRIGLSLVNCLMQLRSGGAVIFPVRSTPEELQRVFSQQRPHRMVSTPALVEKVLNSMGESQIPFTAETTGLKLITLGGSAIAPALLKKIRQHLCAQVQIGYGATEIGTIAIARAESDLHAPGSAGRLVPWMEAEVIGHDDTPVPEGQIGELRFRSPAHANPYIEDADQDTTTTGFRHGWYYPGDMGSIHADRHLILAGRTDHRINLNGVKVDPSRIEALLASHPDVAEAGVIAVTAHTGQMILAAAIVAGNAMSSAELAKLCADHLGASHVPKRFVQVKVLPKTPMGKLDRSALKAGMEHLLRASEPETLPGTIAGQAIKTP